MASTPTGLEIRGPWHTLDESTISEIPVAVGVFEIADMDGNSLALGFAGGHSTFGLRSEIPKKAAEFSGPLVYRIELTMAYQSRLKEIILLGPGRKGDADGSRDI